MQGLQQKYSVCRLCLCSGGLIDIFDQNIRVDIELQETIVDLIRCPIEKEEGFPWLICLTCEAKLIEFRLFKRRCLECKQAFDIRYRAFKPIIIAPANVLSNCSEVEKVPMIRDEKCETDIQEQKKGNGVQPCWLVASGNLYFKEEDDSPMVANVKEEDSVGALNAMEPDDDIIHGSITKITPETMNAGNVAFQEEPTGSVDIEDVTDEVFRLEQMELENTGMEDSTPLCRIVEVGRLNADQFESGSVGLEEQEELSHEGLEPLLDDDDDVPEPSIAEGSTAMAMDVTPIATEAVGDLDIKQEPINWDEVVQENHIKVEPGMEECVPELSISDVNRFTDTDMGAVSSKAIENPSIEQEQAHYNGASQTFYPVEETPRKLCCVQLCQNTLDTPGVKYVRFPKNSTLARKWLLQIGRLDYLQGGLAQYRSSVICTDHFSPSMFDPSGKLVRGAVPTLFSAAFATDPVTPVENANCVPDTNSPVHEMSCKLKVHVLRRPRMSKKFSQVASASSGKPEASSCEVKPRVKAPRKQALKTRPEFGTDVSEAEKEEEAPHTSKPQQPTKPKKARKRDCFVPMCPNKGMKETEKIFVGVPSDSRRQMWLQAANTRDYSSRTRLYCCEDHFEMEEDFINYHEMKYMDVNCLRLRPGVFPRYFDCQVGRTRVHHPKLRELSQRLSHEGFTDELLSEGMSDESNQLVVPSPSTSPVPFPEAEIIEEDTSPSKNLPKTLRKRGSKRQKINKLSRVEKRRCLGANRSRDFGTSNSSVSCAPLPTNSHKGEEEDRSSDWADPLVKGMKDVSSVPAELHIGGMEDKESVPADSQVGEMEAGSSVRNDSEIVEEEDKSSDWADRLIKEMKDVSCAAAELHIGGMEDKSSVPADSPIGEMEAGSSVCDDSPIVKEEENSSDWADPLVKEMKDISSVPAELQIGGIESKSSVPADSQIGEKEAGSPARNDSPFVEEKENSPFFADSMNVGVQDDSSNLSLASQSESCHKPEKKPKSRRKQTFDLSSRTELVCVLDD